jgi:HAMP domain-containing protein
MKNNVFNASICLCLLVISMTVAANAYTTPESIVASGKVYVSQVTYDPAVFFTDDTGTVTIDVTNGNSNQSIVLNHATFSDNNIRRMSGTYDTSANIGPLQTRSFVFSVAARASEGTYYPTFSLSFRDADSLWERTMVQVDNTPLELTVQNKPDTFTQGSKDTISVTVANPRKNDVKNVKVEVSGTGITATPSTIFIGKLASGASNSVNFTVTPAQETTLDLAVKYNNGDNIHTVTTDLPIVFGIDKKQANPVISNVQVKSEAGIYHITGDVTNAGLEPANSVIVTTLSPAVPHDPYKTYVVGALKPDDFASFEVTFSADNGSNIPLQLSFKDIDGNVFTSVQDVKVAPGATSSQKNGDTNLLPVIAGLIIVGIFVGGWVLYLRRNKK